MSRIIQWVQSVAAGLGGPGIFFVAFLDSSFLSLPQVNDLLIVAAVAKSPALMIYYATMATLGSVAGCFIVYMLGRKGGEAFLRRRFHGPTLDRATALFERWGLLAVLVPALLPPPAPFKVFVLLAGVMRVRPFSFLAAVVIGRGVRYFGEGILAAYYGEDAIRFINENTRVVILTLVALVVAGVIVYAVRRRRAVPQANRL
jgi:membrane protein YqaA with SNARE-associated domain